MITNKDIRVENGNLVLNGDKFPLDGQSPEAIMEIVEDNSDTTPTENSDAPITSGGVYTALAGKEDTLTFDTAPTAESANPVTSAGIKTYVDGLYVVERKNKGSSTTITAGNYVRVDIPCAKQGYTALGVLEVLGPDTAGAVTLMQFSVSTDGSLVFVYFANNTAADKTLSDVTVRVLYRKN